ncbi:MAG: adenylate kinase [Candidatus Komeilibacteria bacterium CG_4_10_14_0_2_um_filter_37_10]|uniref:Adenylate kinase n=1 Tax=Candidatus Komeilibacteria bacterium CG_4_10_14_0_2_um_filter_37_10 TaxID=1974470 RepID=A0A2M7VFY1_9BACT|nr:MAG: adenylate kinase [Candidatus Komeilibacteria bacterium CG_4_10_14_0_2_um_filter_37_10]
MKKIVIFGAPGSGKGTMAEFIRDAWQIPWISTGEIFRHEMLAKSELGVKISESMYRGQLVADEVVNQIVRQRLAQDDAQKGFILDGYPRDLAQAQYLTTVINLDIALFIKCSDAIVAGRMAARRTCPNCGEIFNIIVKPPQQENICDHCQTPLVMRPDAQPAAIAERLAIFHKNNDQLIDYYQNGGKLIVVDGDPAINEVWQNIKQVLHIINN